jgi:hypothetical protein
MLLWLIWFLWLPSLPQFSNAAGVGSTFKVCISAKVVLPILGNKMVWISDGLSGLILTENFVKI